MKKTKVTLSLSEDINTKLSELAKENGLNRSSLVTLLISKLEKNRDIFN